MKQFESEHYIFNFHKGSKAEADIHEIAACQEACYSYICSVLKTEPHFKIGYTLCNTREEVGQLYGDNEPCNGFTTAPNKIVAVYNDQIQCIGFHEDAHIISYTLFRPNCPAIREGLAMYFDRKWWGIQNLDWVDYFLKKGTYLPVDKLLHRDFFFDNGCEITYPIMGAFTDYLISTYGIEMFLTVYRQQDIPQAMQVVYHKTTSELNQDFISYVRLFKIDPILEKRMEELLA